MKQINILDCTLRDGGYINDFNFGETVIKDIIYKLSEASVDIIECGFLKSGSKDNEKTLFNDVSSLKKFFVKKNSNLLYVAMIQYGNMSIENIEDYDKTSIDGIRLTFHKEEIEGAFILGEQLKEKGYKVFMQPVGTNTYSEEELKELIIKINKLNPFAFYFVDTMGSMYKKELLKFLKIIDENLYKNIILGFHSHNNLQLSFSNAQELIELNLERKIIIDTSILGMGRGAGNLCTELMTQYINENISLQYDNLKILEIIDEYIAPLKIKYSWGYNVGYYIASTIKCHPSYATFLLNKQTLNMRDIKSILNSMNEEKRRLYDKEYIRNLYFTYLEHNINDRNAREKLKVILGDKTVLIIAPGQSLKTNINKIKEIILKNKLYVISVNFLPKEIPVDKVFVSNKKRFEKLIKKNIDKIITSNVKINVEELENNYIINFASYINEEACITDNAGLMCINLLKSLGIKKILLAGFDGFKMNREENYYADDMILSVEKERLQRLNKAIKERIHQLKNDVNIEFLTESIYNN